MANRDGKRLTLKQKRIFSGVSIAIFVLLSIFICVAVGVPLMRFMSEPERFRLWVDGKGIMGRLAFVGMVFLQVVVAIIPGEPLEIGAGYAFGAVEGTLLCVAGIMLGSAVIFWFVRRFGTRAVEVFFPLEKIQNHRLLQDEKRLNVLAFFAFFIPGTPKDMLSYLIGLTRMKFSTWMFISGVARLPSIITSTVGGDMLGLGRYGFAAIVFGITLLIGIVGLIIYNKVYTKRTNGPVPNTQQRSTEKQAAKGQT